VANFFSGDTELQADSWYLVPVKHDQHHFLVDEAQCVNAGDRLLPQLATLVEIDVRMYRIASKG